MLELVAALVIAGVILFLLWIAFTVYFDRGLVRQRNLNRYRREQERAERLAKPIPSWSIWLNRGLMTFFVAFMLLATYRQFFGY